MKFILRPLTAAMLSILSVSASAEGVASLGPADVYATLKITVEGYETLYASFSFESPRSSGSINMSQNYYSMYTLYRGSQFVVKSQMFVQDNATYSGQTVDAVSFDGQDFSVSLIFSPSLLPRNDQQLLSLMNASTADLITTGPVVSQLIDYGDASPEGLSRRIVAIERIPFVPEPGGYALMLGALAMGAVINRYTGGQAQRSPAR